MKQRLVCISKFFIDELHSLLYYFTFVKIRLSLFSHAGNRSARHVDYMSRSN